MTIQDEAKAILAKPIKVENTSTVKTADRSEKLPRHTAEPYERGDNQMNISNAFCQNGEVLEKVTELDPLHNIKYQRCDEITMGRMFADAFQNIMKYNVTSKSWYIFDGIIWREDVGGVTVGKLAETFVRSLQIYLSENVSGNATQFETAYQKYALRLGDRNKRLKMIDDSKHHSHIKMTDLDANKDLLNLKNGVLNLKTFELTEHRSEDLLSKVCKCSYDPNAQPKDWIKFVNEIFEGDKETIEYVQRLFGYALTAERNLEEAYMFYGKTTRNGKDTLLGTMETMLGDYAKNINPESLKQIDRKGNAPSGDIARLNGCRFVHCSEPPKGMILDIANLKKMTGSKELTARNLFEKDFQFVPAFKLFINTNHRPLVNDMTLFTSGRMKVIECNRYFKEEERDIHLKEKLETDHNLSALLNWCIVGLKAFRGNETKVPQCVRLAIEDYKHDSDKIQNFIDDCIQADTRFNLQFKYAYDAYKSWCQSNGYKAEGKKNFKEGLTAKIPISDNGTVNGQTVHNVLLGFTLTQDGKDFASKYSNYSIDV